MTKKTLFRTIAIGIAALALVIGVAIASAAPRSALVRAGLATYLWTKGYHLEQMSLALDSKAISARDVVILDGNGRLFLSASRIEARIGSSDRYFGLSSIRIQSPHVVIRRNADGSFNVAKLFGGSGSGGERSSLPLVVDASIEDGTLDVFNTTSPSPQGRGFAIRRLNADAHIAQGAVSRGRVTATLSAEGHQSRVVANFTEYDKLRLARASIRAGALPLAPIVDLFVSGPQFVVEDGTMDAVVRGYAIDWSATDAPAWHFVGSGSIRSGRLRTMPLEVPIRDVNGPLRIADSLIDFATVSGRAAGVPLTAWGTVQLLPSPTLGLSIRAAGPLSEVRKLLAFSSRMPLNGRMEILGTIRGSAGSPHADIALHSARGLRYGAAQIDRFSTRVYYHDGQVELRDAFAAFDGASIFGNGNIDLTATPLTGQFQIATVAPSIRIPWIADVDDTGTTRIAAALSGPLTQLAGDGFGESRGRSTTLRATVSGSADRLAMTSVARGRDGGELFGGIEVGRGNDAGVSADLYAQKFRLKLSGRAVTVPGVTRTPISGPRLDANVDGIAALRGTRDDPWAMAMLHARRASIDGVRLGRIDVGGTGPATHFTIDRIGVRGEDIALEATGTLAIAPGRRDTRSRFGGELRGHVSTNLAKVLSFAPVAGRTDGSFGAECAGGRCIADVHLRGTNATVAGMPFEGGDALVRADAQSINVMGATARIGRGELAAAGTLPGSRPGNLTVLVRNVDAGTLRRIGAPVAGGLVVASARLGGTSANPALTAALAITDASFAGRAVSGDAQLRYSHQTVTARDSRVMTGNSLAEINGSASDLGRANHLALDVVMANGDLADIPSTISSVPLTGRVAATLHVGGSVAAPLVSGSIASRAGAIRGVPYEELSANVVAQAGAMDIRDASIQIGSTHIAAAGTLSPGAYALRVKSPRTNLDDFNTFFNGKDVLEGTGAVDLAIAGSRSGVAGSGTVQLHDTRVLYAPLGSIDARLRPLASGTSLEVRQRGAVGETRVDGRVQAGVSGGIPNVDLAGIVRQANLAVIASAVGIEDTGIAGTGRASLRVQGPINRLWGSGRVAVDDGAVRGTRVRSFSATVNASPDRISVLSLRAAVDGAVIDGRGQLDRSGRLHAHATANITDLGALAKLTRSPLSMAGPAVAAVDANGPLGRPSLRASVNAGRGEISDVTYDAISANADFAKGMLRAFGRATVSNGRGTIAFTGSVPIRPDRFTIGPNDRPIAFSLKANGVDLESLSPLLRDRASIRGAAAADFAIRGTAGRPIVSGNAQLRGASMTSRYDRRPITGLDADVAFANDSVKLERFHGLVGKGTLDVRGAAHIVPATAVHPSPNLQYSFDAALQKGDFDVPNLLTGAIDANVSLTKTGTTPYLAGDVGFSDTTVPFATILAMASGGHTGPPPGAKVPGLPPLRPHHTIVYGGPVLGVETAVLRPTPPPRPEAIAIVPHAIDLGLNVTAGKNVRLTGLLNVSGTGAIAISGDTNAPKLEGTITAGSGGASFLGANFELLDGLVTFDPADGLLPTISADALTRTDEADITVTVSGRVDQLHTDLQSDPQMSRDAIIASLLHVPQINSALASSQGVQQSSLGVSPSSLVAGQVAGQILSAFNIGLERVFNIEEVNFAVDQFGNPSLELRKQVGPRAYSLYRTTFTVPAAQAFGIAYRVRRALQVEFTQSQSTPGASPVYALARTMINVHVTFH